jgi:hypothetical protein
MERIVAADIEKSPERREALRKEMREIYNKIDRLNARIEWLRSG